MTDNASFAPPDGKPVATAPNVKHSEFSQRFFGIPLRWAMRFRPGIDHELMRALSKAVTVEPRQNLTGAMRRYLEVGLRAKGFYEKGRVHQSPLAAAANNTPSAADLMRAISTDKEPGAVEYGGEVAAAPADKQEVA